MERKHGITVSLNKSTKIQLSQCLNHSQKFMYKDIMINKYCEKTSQDDTPLRPMLMSDELTKNSCVQTQKFQSLV